MAQHEEDSPFTGFGVGNFSAAHSDDSVFILVVYRDGTLTAAAHATERGAMGAAAELLDDEGEDDEERITLEDRFTRAQRLISDEGGIMDIIPSPVFGG